MTHFWTQIRGTLMQIRADEILQNFGRVSKFRTRDLPSPPNLIARFILLKTSTRSSMFETRLCPFSHHMKAWVCGRRESINTSTSFTLYAADVGSSSLVGHIESVRSCAVFFESYTQPLSLHTKHSISIIIWALYMQDTHISSSLQ